MQYAYNQSNIIEKKEFAYMVSDSNLYYKKGICRTPAMMPALSHSYLIMKEKGLFEIEKKGISKRIFLRVETEGFSLALTQAHSRSRNEFEPSYRFESQFDKNQNSHPERGSYFGFVEPEGTKIVKFVPVNQLFMFL